MSCDEVVTNSEPQRSQECVGSSTTAIFSRTGNVVTDRRFRRDENLTGLIDINDRALELLGRNFWKTVRDFLIR